jgi:hypothetical protein
MSVGRMSLLPTAPPAPAGPLDLPPTAALIVSGGDARIACDPLRGVNAYGCAPHPDPAILAFGSSTASTISPAAYAAADGLRRRLLRAGRAGVSPAVIYAAELARQRAELLALNGLSAGFGVDVVFAASGTDLHRIAAWLAGTDRRPLTVIMVDPAETGSGVAAALSGRDRTRPGTRRRQPPARGRELVTIPIRTADGRPRPPAAVDDEVAGRVAAAVRAGRRVLLNPVDVSKTGLVAPSLACVLGLMSRFPDAIEVTVDACQLRLAPATLRAYLARGVSVALTGSKFVGGPAFCGALLLPARVARRIARLPQAFATAPKAEWPAGWATQAGLAEGANFGLLLRFEAALAEMRAFAALAEPEVTGFFTGFAGAVGTRLASDPAFELLAVPAPDRWPLAGCGGWDAVTTIFPFLLRAGPGGRLLTAAETAQVHALLATDLSDRLSPPELSARRCEVGQPVACGTRRGVPVAALRLCTSMRLAVEAVGAQGRGAAAVIADALIVLDKAALLAARMASAAPVPVVTAPPLVPG